MAHRSNSIMAELPEPEELDFGALAEGWRSGDIDLFVVLGPTASGKTGFAVRMAHALAERLHCGVEIISADSRQVYRGMDIGTGKDLEEYGDVPYHLIDVADPGEGYNVFRFKEDFSRAFDDIRSRGAVAVLCGGTGLYVNAVVNDYDFASRIPLSQSRGVVGCTCSLDDQREGRTAISTAGTAFSDQLANRNDQREGRTAISAAGTAFSDQLANRNDQRAGRTAISTAGTAFPDQLANRNDQREGRTAISVCRPYVIGTLVSREERNARIDARLKARLEAGMVDEIRRLLDSGVPAQTLISYGLEYKFVTLYVLGEMGYDQMYLKLSTAIHQFAKRQMTWFRGMQRSGISIHWVDPGEGSKRIIQTS